MCFHRLSIPSVFLIPISYLIFSNVINYSKSDFPNMFSCSSRPHIQGNKNPFGAGWFQLELRSARCQAFGERHALGTKED
ncbi:hypothetical protein BDZ94DRAFT_1273639 [Collybia nuda]|uniref:Uncharacterized protein n=1 Tax=Collybia nuda TaxID=64659 RepID=A0A9P6CCN1_9AGAR|nr:hypothetical protein BDZ94DRAFT_1273639 [Collybia nuda]